MNWLIKQWFYIRFFLHCKGREKETGIQTFSSKNVNDGQWYKDNAGWWFTTFRQKYGVIKYNTMLGNFNDIWPAMWMVNSEDCYHEVDIELMKGTKHSYLVYTTWVNDNDNSSENAVCKRVRLGSRWMAKRLSREFHEYTIDWNEDRIRYYIDNMLTCVIYNVPQDEMCLSVGNVVVKSIKVYSKGMRGQKSL